MNPLKRLLILVGVIAVAAADIAIYWNFHLYRTAVASAAVNADKVAVLERADRIFPWNELVRFELGQARFGTAMDEIGDAKVRDDALTAALRDFEASLRLNPASARVQFQYAQALLYRSYFAPSDRTRVYEEYKKAARLTGHQAPIYFEVGKILFSQWANLGTADRAFTLDLLATVLRQPEKVKLATVLQIWDLAVRDTAVMDKILPANADACRQYAQFLGEKGLSLDERQRVLAKAEALDFETAKREFEKGDRSFQFLQFDDAFNRYQWCLGILKNIRFYQSLVGDKTIDPDEYRSLLKATYLVMAKCRLEAGRPFADALPYLESYVDLEDEIAALGDLESYFKERGLVEDDLAAGAKDYKLFAFHTLLAFKQSRFRDVIQVGVEMQRGVLVVPEASRPDYAEILELVGESYQKLDYIYESDDYYAKALAINPDDLTVLLKVRKNRERLNDEAGLRSADARIAKILSPVEKAPGDRQLEKGRTFVKTLTLDGSGLTLEISARGAKPGRSPLLTVIWNDRVVWEGLVQTPSVQVDVASRLGANSLSLIPVDTPVILSRIDWEFTKKV
jgi:tetratricopeptide (TPR) repeat protein